LPQQLHRYKTIALRSFSNSLFPYELKNVNESLLRYASQ
jgi:hypothetical protein